MQKIIDQISDHLAGLITSDKPFYTPKELLKAKIPSFIVERIRLSLEDKVKEEIGAIESNWFNVDSKLVQAAWEDFMEVAVSSSHIPREELYKILNTVVSDIVKVFIEPRKNMASYVFRDDSELTLEEIESRCNRLTIYKHFGTAIPLYMRKRELETLTIERCKQLIHNLDAKLVASYSPQDWAQKLEQLFVLFGGEVDPKLLALFFEDKGLSAIAKRFSAKRKLVTKSDFIFIISSKDPDVKKSKTLSEAEEEAKEEEKEQNLIESFFGDYAEDEGSLVEQYVEGGLTDSDMDELLQEIAGDGVVEIYEHDQVSSLNELFQNEADSADQSVYETTEEIAESLKARDGEDQEEIKEFRENLISILDQAKDSFSSVTGEEVEAPAEVADYSDVFEEDSITNNDESTLETAEDEIDDDDAENKPMWAKFLNAEQMQTMMGEEDVSDPNIDKHSTPTSNDSGLEVIEDSEIESVESDEIDFENVFDDNPAPNEIATDIEDLEDILKDRKVEFLSTIFQNSEDQYLNALKTLSGFTVWKDASDYIKNEIFAKNDVDLFSGATVDFTDRMHHYFNER